MQAGGRLVEDEQYRLVGCCALAGVLAQAEEVGELDALALAAAEGAAALTESDVAQSYIVQRLETGRDTGGGRLAGSG